MSFEEVASKAFVFNVIGNFETNDVKVNNFIFLMKELINNLHENDINTIRDTIPKLNLETQLTVKTFSNVLIEVLRKVFKTEMNWGRIVVGFKFVNDVVKSNTQRRMPLSRFSLICDSAILCLKTMLVEYSEGINQNGGLENGFNLFANKNKKNDGSDDNKKMESFLNGFIIGISLVYFVYNGLKLATN